MEPVKLAPNFAEHAQALSRIKLLLLDVDGVLTRGEIAYTDEGVEIKTFNAKDGQGIKLLSDFGITVGIVTGRGGPALERRCRDLPIAVFRQRVRDKAAELASILAETGFSADQAAFMGDDLPDIPIMRRTGFGIAPSDAREDVIRVADAVTVAPGGAGAVREAVDAILMAKGLWGDVLARFS